MSVAGHVTKKCSVTTQKNFFYPGTVTVKVKRSARKQMGKAKYQGGA